MSAIYAPGPWPFSQAAPRQGPWVFAREVVLAGVPGAPRALQWLLRRHSALTLRQFGLVCLSLCAASVLVATLFFAQRAPALLSWVALTLLGSGLAMALFARHAGDREILTLVGRSLRVERCIGSQIERADFAADWLRVEPAAGQRSLVQLSGRGQRMRVGRFLQPELRAAFARELRHALRRVPARTGPENPSN